MSRLLEATFGDASYPDVPGYKEPTTSRIAADDLAGYAAALGRLVLLKIAEQPRTADEVADSLGLSVLTVRPRVSELRNQGKVRPKLKPDGKQLRRLNESGKSAIVWEAGEEPKKETE